MPHSTKRIVTEAGALVLALATLLISSAAAETVEVKVTAVVRGDVLVIDHDGATETVLVYGVECSASNTPIGAEARAYTRDALLGNDAAWRLVEPAWGGVQLDEPFFVDREERLEARFFPVAPKVPTFLRGSVEKSPETTVGLRLTETRSGRRLVFVPGLPSLDEGTLAELTAADCRFVDGTFYTSDELRSLRPGAPDAVAMGHLPIAGPGGSLARLASLPGRTLYIHMNNTNPVLDASSPEARAVRDAGIEIASDGQELEL